MTEVTPESGTQQTDDAPENTGAQRGKFKRRGGTRNQNLAQMESALKDFTGKIDDLPVLGKQHEIGVTYEKFSEDLMDYVSINIKKGEDLRCLIEDLYDSVKKVIGKEPEEKTGDSKFKIDYSRYLDKSDLLQENKKKLFTLIIGQCTPGLMTAIKSHSEYASKSKLRDPKWLLGLVKKLTVGIEETANTMKTVHDCVRKIYTLYQKPVETIDDYFDRFAETWNTAEAAGGSSVLIPSLPSGCKIYGGMADEALKDAAMAMFALLHSDHIRFGQKIKEIEENVVLGVDNFPRNMDGAYRILTDTQDRLNKERRRYNGNSNVNWRNTGVSHYQGGRGNSYVVPQGCKIVVGTDNRVHNVQCNKCKEWGHYAGQCPDDKEVSKHVCMHNKKVDNQGKTTRYLLDSATTHTTVNNLNNITNMKHCNKQDILHTQTNSGFINFNMKGNLDFIPIYAHYNKDSAANILAFHRLNAIPNAYMFYDGSKEDVFHLKYYDGREILFPNDGNGLYYVDAPTKEKVLQFLQTVKDKIKLMTRAEKEKADRARDEQEYLCWPSTKEFLNIVETNQLKNCETSTEDIRRAVHIYGEPVPYLKRRMTRPKPEKHEILC